MDYRDYYEVLGVPRSASQAEIRKAYRRLARQHHPDVKPGDRVAEQRFKDLNEANTVLSDPEKRRKYDTLGKDWEAYERAGAAGAGGAGAAWAGGAGAGGGPSGGGPGGNVRYEFRTSGDAGFSDFFRMFFGSDGGARDGGTAGPTRGRSQGRTSTIDPSDLEDLLAGMGAASTAGGPARSGRSAGSRSSARLPAVEATAELTLEEAFHGTTRLVELDGRRLEVTIPRGVATGSRVRLSGKGGEGRDLIVVCRVAAHPTFTRRGADLEREVPISLREALLGAGVRVSTLKGGVLLTIPAGTSSGRTFRLAGQGMPRLGGGPPGDLYVRVRVVVPKDLSDEARAAAERFLDLVPSVDPRT